MMTAVQPDTVHSADATAIEAAASMLAEGRLIAFPTETVYGLGADATSDDAVARIFEAKGRPRFNPLIVHVFDRQQAAKLVMLNPLAESLADAFWPGPFTMVLPRGHACPVSLLCSAGLSTLAVRVPSHAVARALLQRVERPIAAPSANRSGHISPTTAQHVAESLGNAVDLILDAGPCPVGLESTVVDLSGAEARLLRPGAVTAEQIEANIGTLVDATRPDPESNAAQKPRSPGQLESHYAPSLPLRLDAETVGADEALLAFGANPPAGAALTRNLSETGDLTEAAANFFAHLHALDQPGLRAIAVMPIPSQGLGMAINDRLRRAAAPR